MLCLLVVVFVVVAHGDPFPCSNGVTCNLIGVDEGMVFGRGGNLGSCHMDRVDWIFYDTPQLLRDEIPPTAYSWGYSCHGYLQGNHLIGTEMFQIVVQLQGTLKLYLNHSLIIDINSTEQANFTSFFNFSAGEAYPIYFEYVKSNITSGALLFYWSNADSALSIIESHSFVNPEIMRGLCGYFVDENNGYGFNAMVTTTHLSYNLTNFDSINAQTNGGGTRIVLFGIFDPPHQVGYEQYTFLAYFDDHGYVYLDGAYYHADWQTIYFDAYLEAGVPIQIQLAFLDLNGSGGYSFQWKLSNQTVFQYFNDDVLLNPDITIGNWKCESYFNCHTQFSEEMVIKVPKEELIGAHYVIHDNLIITKQSELIVRDSNVTVEGNLTVFGNFTTHNSTVKVQGHIEIIQGGIVTLNNTHYDASNVHVTGSLMVGVCTTILTDNLTFSKTASLYVNTDESSQMQISQCTISGVLYVTYLTNTTLNKYTVLQSDFITGQFSSLVLVGAPPCVEGHVTYSSVQVGFQLYNGCDDQMLVWILVGVIVPIVVILCIGTIIYHNIRKQRIRRTTKCLRQKVKEALQ